jgi:hypothetical protein
MLSAVKYKFLTIHFIQLCMDLNLPVPFESAIILSMNEQIQAYRSAVHFRWISTHEEYLTQNLSQNSRVKAHVPILPILTCSTAIRSKIERCTRSYQFQTRILMC